MAIWPRKHRQKQPQSIESDWQSNLGRQERPSLSIIVPTYNERENIALLLELLHKHLRECVVDGCGRGIASGIQTEQHATGWWEVLVVDDASPDGTADEVKTLQGDALLGRNLRLISRPGKLGLGTAYKAGLQQAQGDWVVLMDADLSHHPKYLPAMLQTQAATGCDVVSSTRYKQGGGVSGWNWKRKLISRGANLLAATLLGVTTQSDLTGAYRLYRRSCLEELLKICECKGYAFQMEVAVRAQYLGYKVTEVPIVFVDRLFGTSKLGASEFLGFIAGLLRLMMQL